MCYIQAKYHTINYFKRDNMIKKTPFYTHEVLDEPIYFEFTDGVQAAIHVSDKTPLTFRTEYEHIDRILRIERLKNCKRKKAFSPVEHKELLQDRSCGMSIRELAKKYDKSTRTIQKYLKTSLGADEMDL